MIFDALFTVAFRGRRTRLEHFTRMSWGRSGKGRTVISAGPLQVDTDGVNKLPIETGSSDALNSKAKRES